MQQTTLRQLEKELWDAADDLRANSKLTAAEYKDPLLGLVLLRFAQNRYEEAKTHIEASLPINPRTGQQREATKDDFLAAGALMLPENAKYDHLAALPESENIAEAINEAMKNVEAEYPDLQGILPKNYQVLDAKLLRSLIRVFNKDAVKNASGDVFGRIYEYFLMKFSMQGAGAQEGGEFFTPPSLVDLIVHIIQPDHGIIHDPACGSGGMFVQTAHFIKSHENKQVNEAITVYGTEYKTNTTRLAKMNLAIHGIEGKIINDNSFYSDPHQLLERCDFVMANPPFNVDKVDAKNKFLTEDKRLPFGPPLTGKGTIPNANYLWIQYFHSYLNENGRAGFVMASSATDAGRDEKRIREQLIETGDVDIIVAIGNNFFYTRSLPCHLWFLDKGKRAENRDKILMIDARNLYRVVTTTINDFSPGQLANLETIAGLYRGEENAYANAIASHRARCHELQKSLLELYLESRQGYEALLNEDGWDALTLPPALEALDLDLPQAQAAADRFATAFAAIEQHIQQLHTDMEKQAAAAKAQKLKKADITKLTAPTRRQISQLSRPLKAYQEAIAQPLADMKQAAKDWKALTEYFPDGRYADVEGLCKIVNLDEVREQDYSLTPGRYVGVALDIDMDYDYKGRMREIQAELKQLNEEANALMEQIQAISL